MKTTTFNPTQAHLLNMFARNSSESFLQEIKIVLTKYLSERVDSKLNQLWDEGVLDQKRLDELHSMHLRTELK